MATRPSDDATWDANDTNSTKPTSGYIDDGFSAGDRPPAAWANWLWQINGLWQTYFAALIGSDEELTYQSAKSRSILLGPGDFTHDGDWAYAPTSGGVLESSANDGLAAATVRLPIGCTITGVRAMVSPGSARAILVPRMRLFLIRKDISWSTPSVSDTEVAAASTPLPSTSNQIIDLGSLSETVGADEEFLVQIRAGNDSPSAHNPDLLLAVEIQFDDIGPRNA